jgi:hypothetical protein
VVAHPRGEPPLVDVVLAACGGKDRPKTEPDSREAVFASQMHPADAPPKRVGRLPPASRTSRSSQSRIHEARVHGVPETRCEEPGTLFVDPPAVQARHPHPWVIRSEKLGWADQTGVVTKLGEQLLRWPASSSTSLTWSASATSSDCRIEWNDRDLVTAVKPHMGYVWLGVYDDGGQMPDSWFDTGTRQILTRLAAYGTVLTHCHMGINRGPSMGYAAMLALGWDPVEGLDRIRCIRRVRRERTRLVAAGQGATQRIDGQRRIRDWRRDNHLDVRTSSGTSASRRAPEPAEPRIDDWHGLRGRLEGPLAEAERSARARLRGLSAFSDSAASGEGRAACREPTDPASSVGTDG